MVVLLGIAALSGCDAYARSMTRQFGASMAHAIQMQQEPDTVKVALPSYLLLLDAMIYEGNDDIELLRAAALLNSAYANLFVGESDRRKLVSDKALHYAERAACLSDRHACDITTMSLSHLDQLLGKMDMDSLPVYYTLASAWAAWIQANSDNWDAVAKLAQVASIFQKVIAVDETYDHGGAHVYLGVIATLQPESMGGHPQEGKAHFERAIEVSAGSNAMAKVVYAERYARLVFDRKLHDELLQQVLMSPTEQGDMTLLNAIAKQKATQLLATADHYFE